MLIIRTLRGVPVTCCRSPWEARRLMAGMEHHYVTPNRGAEIGPHPGADGKLSSPHPVEAYASRMLTQDVERLAAAWKSGCNRGPVACVSNGE